MKPEYFFRPQQLVRRILRSGKPKVAESKVLTLPWGTPIRVGIHETIGFAIWHLGVYELSVSETLWRLIDEGESVLDIGANLGHMTSLMVVRTGASGCVIAFEPHPRLNAALLNNVGLWKNCGKNIGSVRVISSALADKNGEMKLIIPGQFSENEGVAFISNENDSSLNSVLVKVERLDSLFNASTPIPLVAKIDVEGAEYRVLKGAGTLITERKIRDIIFEDHKPYPTEATQLLEASGYTIFRLERGFLRPLLVDPKSLRPMTVLKEDHWEPVNYLATVHPNRAKERFGVMGWKCLQG